MTLKPSEMLLYMVGLAYRGEGRDVNTAKSYLLAAFDDIEGANDGVRETTGENTTNHALGVVGRIVFIS